MTTLFVSPLLKEPPVPERYVVRTTYTTCLCCGHAVATSEFLAMSLIRARHNLGQPVRHYEACSRPEYNIPVDHVAAPPRTTAFCVRCHAIDLSHLPPPPLAARLNTIPEPTLKGQPVKKAAAPAAARPRLEDLA